MGRFIEGADRRQATLLPDTLDVGEERVIAILGVKELLRAI
jgi:hypothetical protein